MGSMPKSVGNSSLTAGPRSVISTFTMAGRPNKRMQQMAQNASRDMTNIQRAPTSSLESRSCPGVTGRVCIR